MIQQACTAKIEISRKRQRELEHGIGQLTPVEAADGWHFCLDWDGMLIHPTDEEGECCTCTVRSTNLN